MYNGTAEHTLGEQTAMFVGGGLMIFLTLLGNIIVLVVYRRKRHLHTISNLFLASLAVSDIMVALVPLTFYLIYAGLGYWPLGKVFCNIYLVIDYVCCQVSVNHMVVICLNLYLVIYYPFKYKNQSSKRKAKIALAIVWTVALLQWTPWIISYQFIVGENQVPEGECYVQFLYGKWYMSYMMAFFSYFFPLTLICVGYYRISRYIHARLRQPTLPGGGRVHRDKAHLLRHKRRARQFVVITCAFAVTCLPFNLVALVGPHCAKCIPDFVQHLSYFLFYFNSTINPLCYALAYPPVRKGFKLCDNAPVAVLRGNIKVMISENSTQDQEVIQLYPCHSDQ